MSLSGDFGAVERFASALGRLEALPAQVAERAAPVVEAAIKAELAPGRGNGWAPGLTVRARGHELVVDAGDPARLPMGIPQPPGLAELVDKAAQEAFARALEGAGGSQ